MAGHTPSSARIIRLKLAKAVAAASSMVISSWALAVDEAAAVTESRQTMQAQKPTELPTVQVVARREAFENAGLTKDKKEVDLNAGGTTLIEDSSQLQRNISNLSDMLRYVPGIWTQSHAGGDSIFLSSRGSNLDGIDYDRNGVKMLQDGLSVTAADGNAHNRIVDPLSAHYAVFARGANAMKYGSSTLGGAINFVSPTAYDSPRVQLFAGGGSFGQMQGRATVSDVFNDALDALVTVEAFEKDGYRDHGKNERKGLYGNAGIRLSENVGTRFYITAVDSDQELPRTLTRAQFEQDPTQATANAILGNQQVNVETQRIANKTAWAIDADRRLEFGLSFEKQKLYHPIAAPNEWYPGSPGYLINTDHEDSSAMLRYEQQLGSHVLLFGVNYAFGTIKGGNYGNNAGMPTSLQSSADQKADTLEAFVMDRWQLNERLILVPALQFVRGSREINDSDASGIPLNSNVSGDYDSVNPAFGLTYKLAGSSELYANISRLYEPPTTMALQDQVAGNGNALAAMDGTVVEIGTRGRQELSGQNSWSWELSAYYAKIKDEILSVDDPSSPGTSLYSNIDSTIHAGIEAALGASLAVGEGHAITPRLALTINDFKFDGDASYGNNKLPAAPDYVLNGELLYHHASGFYAGPTIDLVGKRYADFNNTYEVDSYSLLGFITGWSNDRMKVYLDARNLLDKNHVATVSVRNTAAASDAILNPGEGRAAYAGIELRF